MADRKALFALLADAQRLVTLSKQHRIRVQKQVVADLERGGKDSSSKQGVLRELQDFTSAPRRDTRSDSRATIVPLMVSRDTTLRSLEI